jgi:hypothetical protein
MIVKTQAELDAALANPRVSVIEIRSEAGVWLTVEGQRPDTSVVARGSSRVVARGSSSVDAWGSSSVVARGSSRVVARGSSSVVARGSSRVVARDSSRVVARDSSSVVARDSSSVVARDSSSVDARDSSSVDAWGSSRVVAWDSSRVDAWDSSRVDATPHVAIHLHSVNATVAGGVVIDVTEVNKTAEKWTEHHGLNVTLGKVILFKAVNDSWTTDRGFNYAPGQVVTAPDWRNDGRCGGGLHLGPTPRHAKDYFTYATRFVAVEVDASELSPIDDSYATPKAKARTCRVLHEVDVDGNRVSS